MSPGSLDVFVSIHRRRTVDRWLPGRRITPNSPERISRLDSERKIKPPNHLTRRALIRWLGGSALAFTVAIAMMAPAGVASLPVQRLAGRRAGRLITFRRWFVR